MYIVCVAGDAPPIEADEQFASHCDTLQQLLARQGEVYEAEERALKVMISEQVESELTQRTNCQLPYEDTSECVCVCVCVCVCDPVSIWAVITTEHVPTGPAPCIIP